MDNKITNSLNNLNTLTDLNARRAMHARAAEARRDGAANRAQTVDQITSSDQTQSETEASSQGIVSFAGKDVSVTNKANWNLLPLELKLNILSFLANSKLLKHLRLVNREFKDFADRQVEAIAIRESKPETNPNDLNPGQLSCFISGFPKLTAIKLGNFSDLTRLNVENFSTADSLIHSISSFSQLSKLDLGGCMGLTDLGMQSILLLTNLKDLNVGGCFRLTENARVSITQLTGLEKLRLSGINSVNDTVANELVRLTNLRSLIASATERQLTNNGIAAIAQITCLRELDLSGCFSITDIGVQALTRLSNLESLIFRVCTLDSAGILSFAQLNNLKVLDLRNSRRIQHADLQMLVQLSNFRILHEALQQ